KQDVMQALSKTSIHKPKREGMQGAIDKTNKLLEQIPNSFSPQQFSKSANPDAYYQTLAPEIWKELRGEIDVFVAGAGSGGTFMGISRYLKEKSQQVKTVIVEPEGSIIAGGKAGP